MYKQKINCNNYKAIQKYSVIMLIWFQTMDRLLIIIICDG
jgi:hypothetical protein